MIRWTPAFVIAAAHVLAMPSPGPVASAQEASGPPPALERPAVRDDGTRTPTLFTDRDIRFLVHMIVHHEQAVVMSSLVPERTDRDEFHRFARYVSRGQAAEIEIMQSLLDLAAQRGLDVPAHRPQGDPPMAGMLSSVQMDVIEAASGAEFERLWMQGMIYHHEGAIAMARAQQRRQREQGRRPYGIEVLVQEMLVEQRAEIGRMRDWLCEWGLAPASAEC